jgi:predicted negative regulator of RcsB-dependent stress response
MAGVILGGFVVIVAVFGWRFWNERQTVRASAALEQAMEVFQARIRAVGEPEQPGEITYVAERNKYDDAAKKFAEVAREHSRTRPGQVARYYAALSLERVGRSEEAQKWLEELIAGGDAELAALARFHLAQLHAKAGRGEAAVKLYQELIARPATLVPKPVAMLALADHYRKSNPPEAVKLYSQIKADYPDTSIADEAERRLESLGPSS